MRRVRGLTKSVSIILESKPFTCSAETGFSSKRMVYPYLSLEQSETDTGKSYYQRWKLLWEWLPVQNEREMDPFLWSWSSQSIIALKSVENLSLAQVFNGRINWCIETSRMLLRWCVLKRCFRWVSLYASSFPRCLMQRDLWLMTSHLSLCHFHLSIRSKSRERRIRNFQLWWVRTRICKGGRRS